MRSGWEDLLCRKVASNWTRASICTSKSDIQPGGVCLGAELFVAGGCQSVSTRAEVVGDCAERDQKALRVFDVLLVDALDARGMHPETPGQRPGRRCTRWWLPISTPELAGSNCSQTMIVTYANKIANTRHDGVNEAAGCRCGCLTRLWTTNEPRRSEGLPVL